MINSYITFIKEHLLIKGIKVLIDQGLRSFIHKANKKYLFNRSIKGSPLLFSDFPSTASTLGSMGLDEFIQTKVSVIIPTKNAGDEFDYTMRRIMQQEGFGSIELIIIDSGSEDKTLHIAKKYAATIFQIDPQDFYRERVLNYGAEKATGVFLVFTVQDAIPVGNNWLYKLLLPIHTGNIAAVSALQIPRSDADLFASWSYWAHNIKFFSHDKDVVYTKSDFENFDEQAKRTVACLDHNVSLGIKKEIFDSCRSHADYDEDIELGIRLIRDGHALMFQSSNAVIHSHNRTSLHYLKRSYLDKLSICNLLCINRDHLPSQMLMESLCYTYGLLKKCLQTRKRVADGPSFAVLSLIDDMHFQNTKDNPSACSLQGDVHLDSFFSKVLPIKHEIEVMEIHNILCDNLKCLAEYLSRYSSIEGMEQDFINCFYNIFCTIAGAYIAAKTLDNIEELKGCI